MEYFGADALPEGHPGFFSEMVVDINRLSRFWWFAASVKDFAGPFLRATSIGTPQFAPFVFFRGVSPSTPNPRIWPPELAPTGTTAAAAGHVCTDCPFTFQPILWIPSLANLPKPAAWSPTEARFAQDPCLPLVGEVEKNCHLDCRARCDFLALEMAAPVVVEPSAPDDIPASLLEHSFRS